MLNNEEKNVYMGVQVSERKVRVCVSEKQAKNVSVCFCVCVYYVLVSCWHVFVWEDLIPIRMASAHYSSDIVLQTSLEGSVCWEIKQRK